MAGGASIPGAYRRRRSCRWPGVGRALLLFFLMLPGISGAQAQAVKGQVETATTGGYARIVLHLNEEVESDVKVAGGIIVVTFKRPVDIGVNTLASAMPDYVGVARRDPDGTGLRIALARKVTVNSMAAGERIFIDLLPDTWSGLPPGLPQEVIEDLARRARDAERALRQQRQWAQKQKPKLIRVRVATQPTFTRYVFELNDVVPITSDRVTGALTVTFGAPLNFDLADAKANLPGVLKSIEAETGRDSVAVRFAFIGKADARTFREDNNYIVDIGASDAKESAIDAPVKLPDLAALAVDAAAGKASLPGLEAPQTTPANLVKEDEGRGPAPIVKPAAKFELAQAKPQAVNAAQEPKDAPAKSAAAEPVAAPSPAIQPARDTAPATPPAAKAASAETKSRDPNAVAVEFGRQGDTLQLTFPFAQSTPAAVFRRADALWLVFDTANPIDVSALQNDSSNTIRSASVVAQGDMQVVRLMLQRPRLVSVGANGSAWSVTIGDAVAEPTRPLGIARNMTGPSRASVTIPFEDPRGLHRLTDPEIGDTLYVITALGPSRGFLRNQDFIEFRALASMQGVIVQPLADDVVAELSADKIVVGRPGGLTLSGVAPSGRNSAAYRPLAFDAQVWGFDRQSNFTERQYKLIAAAADAAEGQRAMPRLALARFYLAQDMFVEAKAVLDIAIAEDRPTPDDPTPIVLHAVTNIMLNRPDEALKDLADPMIGNQFDAPLWRAFAYARQNKWADARKGFKNVEAAIATLPVELQRLAVKEALRAAIEVRDFAGADQELHEFETIGIPKQMEPAVLVLTGRLAQGLGKNEDALKYFRAASDSASRPAAAEGRLREVALRYGLGDLKRSDVISELETLTALWRGDETEIEALQLLARLYHEEGRYRDAFYVMRTALKAHPNSELTRRIHDEAVTAFDTLFLAGKGDALPAIDALSLFYDFRELTPIGRRGDEMIRRLADRLVSVDLLYQASELLQHQIDNRLQGAARSQVATRLAVIYLMDRKPEKALAVIKATRMSELPNELRQLRLLLEARSLSDLGRYDVALEVIANIDKREAIRLRSDILWAAKRWQQAAEQIELLYGDRWRDFEPLNDAERSDILRAAYGYALGEDAIGLGRLREKYAGKMADSADRAAFEVTTGPLGVDTKEFTEISKKIAATDTLDSFLRDMRAGYPEIAARPSADNSLPKIEARPPAMSKGEPASTGSIALPPRRTAAR